MRKIRLFHWAWPAALCAALAGASRLPAAGPGDGGKPNILLILTDDQGWGDVRSHGNPRIDTPWLDRLASEGARFERFFVNPVCSPTRASLLTGRYALRTGVYGVTRRQEIMRSDEITIAEMLRGAGYATGCFGKWHNGSQWPHHPNAQGFDEFYGLALGHWCNYFDTQAERNGEPADAPGYIADALAGAAIDFISASRSAPFFCYVAFNTPHMPLQAPEDLFQKYRARGFDERDACIMAMCENIDSNVGRMLEALDEHGLASETIVIFLSDNGPNTDRYNGEMRGRKASLHEGGVRAPCFVRWPGRIEPGLVIEPIAAHIDWLPTLAELAGAPLPRVELDGRSLAPLLLRGAAEWPPRMIFTHATEKRGAVRTETHRFVVEDGKRQLYDMIRDPRQQTDIAGEHPDLANALASAYIESYRDVARGGLETPPIEIGHREMKRVELSAPEARLSGGLRYMARSGYAHDWIVNWKSELASASWDIEVVRAGRYALDMLYACPQKNVGVETQAEIDGAILRAAISAAHDPPPRPSPDLYPRHEAYEKEWAVLPLGEAALREGRSQLTIRATKIPGEEAMELKAVRIVALDE